jgi:hypothetical protein
MNAKQTIQRLREHDVFSDPDFDNPDLWEPDPVVMERVMGAMKDRFIKERVAGFTHPSGGASYPPVSREQAEQRWLAAEPHFREVLKTYDPKINRQLGGWRRKQLPTQSSAI